MSILEIKMRSNVMMRPMEFAMFLPDDQAFNFSAQNNPCYDRPMKTLIILHGYTVDNYEWMSYSTPYELALKYNLAVVIPSTDSSFYLDRPGTGNKVGSFVCEPIMKGPRAAGMVLFIKEHEQVEFSADMLEAFRIATKLVRDHILRIKSEKDNSFLMGVLGAVIDIPGIKTHVIDDSYRLLKKGEEGEPLTWGGKCYEELFGQKKPCKDCLIKHISKENERIEDAKTSATMISVGRFNRVYVVMEKEQ